MNYSWVWVSHSSISDYIKCPRLYYLRNVYKNPRTGHKVAIMTPPLALGQAVHDTLEYLATLPVDKRKEVELPKLLDKSWEKVSGEKGGFDSPETESNYKLRAGKMIEKVQENFAVLLKKAVRITPRDENGKKSNLPLPQFVLSKKDNIKLCGKIDWLEFDEESQTVRIIDFKTGKNEEDSESLQLPIYFLIAKYCQRYPVSRVSYWYLETDDLPKEMPLPQESESRERILRLALQIKEMRNENRFDCPRHGCFACLPYEQIIAGKGKLVGRSIAGQDVFILTSQRDLSQGIMLVEPLLRN